MTIQHKNIANADLHEAKGVSAAVNGQILKAASGVNSWAYQEYVLNFDIVNLVTDGSYFIPVPYACDIVSWQTCIDNAFDTADCALSLEIATVAVTDSSITITQSGSAAGDVDSATPTAALSVAAGGAIEIIVSGTNTTATRCHVAITVLRTA